ncbi:DNA/RNA nuclease SfsA [Idiomarina tyrosinivorans]|uniref:Sugar fermentation stimulation protein homolog n=1 Tax=Idiomarina tyrosinivorans TaxID=1445662 RepID=A0A432ZS30_9GAMM|nr:DNA/RNA nuclease SfsA [Idiomarina tyrosinivorans]RUO80672.1 DNA/RNA nuclease SfsA [Idiomarina tyrosinivorans]
MQFNPPLQQGKLLRRYKRFLADIEWPNGEVETVHCPNTGAMTGCAEAGFGAACSRSNNPKRKYSLTLELTQDKQNNWIAVNTQRANQVAGEALRAGFIADIDERCELQPERRYGEQNSRIDWFTLDHQQRQTYIEVKSVTLAQGARGLFPDTVSQRASKHVQELMAMREQGHRAILLFVALHSAIRSAEPATEIDPKYAEICKQAAQKGVECYAVGCEITPEHIIAKQLLPVPTWKIA